MGPDEKQSAVLPADDGVASLSPSALSVEGASWLDLWNEHRIPLTRYALSLTHQEDAADELLAELQVRMPGILRALRPGCDPLPYLFGATIRIWASIKRQAKKRRQVSVDPDTFDLLIRVDRRRSESDVAVALDEALERLPESSRQLLKLVYGEGLKLKEAAHRLGLTIDQAAYRRLRALEMLRHRLSPHKPR